MKIFFSENRVDYSTYTFDYAIYCLKESQSELSEIYEKGFLPYTGNLSIEGDIFYLARSLRVELDRFEDTSENRRVNRLVEPLNIQLEVIKKEDFDLNSTEFVSLCQEYISQRIGDDNMSMERWQYILSRQTGTHLFRFSIEGKLVGFVFAVMENNMLHYWFAFFDTEYMRSHSLGKWIMWRVIRWAKENNLKYVYLGTAYKTSALYKIRDHKGLAYFDGFRWNRDIERLKLLCKADLEPKVADEFKTLSDQNEFLNQLNY
ncbi:Aspartate/glutamate leucyltransferase [Emticicia aquatica]|jgi:arginine-tRNA-protein transferase|uniref:Aspartate/glutamate leucyltransferase n=1 Tax=Emticicia aquatica TaxID=1681835 RepID=A0ABN8EXC8_9BACT|nr:GNAT family N-acetyltransferase [Emticicia aquatica]CAH0996765.1 Aspartate/glutamate leucyltransferase [Emticicia aquatica]